jgi:predicted transcriptional regulator
MKSIGNLMAKAQYRSKMAQTHEILAIISYEGQEGTNVSNIAHKANLSHHTVIESCKQLVESGLIEQHIDKRNRIFQMTDKGMLFYKEMDRFQNIVCSLNLKY